MKPTIAILTASLLLIGAPLALADETKADCESGQGWIGYTSTDTFEDLYHNQLGQDTLLVCEGEHWDGQDSLNSHDSGYTGPDCWADNDVSNPVEGAWISHCQNSDSGATATGVSPTGSLTPVGLRASFLNSPGAKEAYVGLEIALVGHARVYAGYCDGSGAGLEGAAACNSDNEGRVGTYVRDNTPGNVLATAVSAPGITQGFVSEADCSQAEYQAGAEARDRTKCGRDNTAITAQILA